MRTASRLAFLLLAIFLSAYSLAARQNDSRAHPSDRIYPDVVVTHPSGVSVTKLERQDITIFDNDVTQDIASFESGGLAPHGGRAAAKRLGDANPEAQQEPALDERDASEDRLKNLGPEIPSYVDMPFEELLRSIPDLKDIQAVKNQEQLPMILKNVGRNVDDFMHNVGELIASEDVTQEKLNANGKIKGKEHVQDDYLILHHGYEWGANAEYRMDKNGNRLGAIGLEKGYLVTAGYALSCITFATVTQAQSNFLYLGEQKVGARDAVVVAYAQRPGDATFSTVMRGTGNHEVSMLTQGILWIDKNSFQILRMRSDLLTPNTELRLDQSTTDVSFGEVRLQDNPDPLWLPKDVSVFMKIANERYRNLHHYTNYRRYQVAVKIGN